MQEKHSKHNLRPQRISPWAHMADELRVEARKHAQHDMQLGLMFRTAQEEAYAAWSAWDEAMGVEGDGEARVVREHGAEVGFWLTSPWA